MKYNLHTLKFICNFITDILNNHTLSKQTFTSILYIKNAFSHETQMWNCSYRHKSRWSTYVKSSCIIYLNPDIVNNICLLKTGLYLNYIGIIFIESEAFLLCNIYCVVCNNSDNNPDYHSGNQNLQILICRLVSYAENISSETSKRQVPEFSGLMNRWFNVQFTKAHVLK